MQIPRFFVEDLTNRGSVELDDNERRHAVAVLRLRTGDRAIVFDGKGTEANVEFREVTRHHAIANVLESFRPSRELPHPLSMAVALPKGDRQKVLVDGLTELGVTSLTPLICERGVAQPTDSALQRLERSVIEASKQCTRVSLMKINAPRTIRSLIENPTETFPDLSLNLSSPSLYFAHPYRLPEHEPLAVNQSSHGTLPVVIAVGPEGGFTDQEAAVFSSSQWQRLELGPRILRVEIAAIAIAAQMSACMENRV